ncbi:hypothetical protein DL764_005347 [Monosporascus ibericus]|uniref:mRNA export factor MEX67 n=1 Tax=Monosporascus ibericus TaxID=155417 RepID=A0A4Q4TCH2_9PEZI|nr:hypothetical protein DL764_005347 [Monosporascus ibericus]
MAPTGPRNQAPSSRRAPGVGKTQRGGIAKRRAGGPVRVDRDGDLDMDGPAGANGKKPANHPAANGSARAKKPATASTRAPKPTTKTQQIINKVITSGDSNISSRISNGMAASSRPNRGARQINAPNSMTLKVEGLKSSRAVNNEGGGLKELLTFLERKAQTVGKITRPVRIKKSHVNGDFVYITASKEDAEEILKLNNFSWAGTTLSISETSESIPAAGQAAMSSDALEIKEQLRNILSLRYDVETKFLNLSTLGEDPGLQSMGFFSSETGPDKMVKMFRALMAICDGIFKTPKDRREQVVSVSLAGNNIDDVLQIMALSDTFPELVNLDLSRNQFKDLKGLQKWRHRLRNIQTLLLNENPIEITNPTYKVELMSWFPKLQNLSGSQVRTPEQVAAEEAASRPTPIPQNGPDFRDIGGIGEGFIKEFMRMYDIDRHALAAKYYDDQSTFSVSVNNRAPHPPDVQPPTWSAYIKFSRNHAMITHQRYQRLFTGTNLIQGIWQKLPPTSHPDLATQIDKYMIDCHPISGLADLTGREPNGASGMIITIHGEFDDQDPDTMKTAKRSFSRTLILGPGVPDRNPIRVISDMLTLKAYNPLQPVQSLQPSDQEVQKQQMVLELSKQTGMTPEYSKLCLEGVHWNFEQALVAFNEKKAQLPSDAFAMPLA